MDLTFTNTRTGSTEPFIPLHPRHVHMYHCGPTVYDAAHIGNLRSYVFADTLRRMLEQNGYEVTQIINITDVGHLSGENEGDADSGEDKMTKGLRRENLPLTRAGMKELADIYIARFQKDLDSLNILSPTHLPRASEHINEQITLTQRLESAGYTYTTSDGVYFDTSQYHEYGTLGGLTPHEDNHNRIAENTEKRNQRDFALWKFNNELGWDAPWGVGFPGWHIECSAMSMKYLGETFDIHTGGIDHIPVHHNNEIAQAESATGKPLARYWLHHAHVLFDGAKISKSQGTNVTLDTLRENGISPLAYRYWLLTAHYRSPVTFTYEAGRAAQTALIRIANQYRELNKTTSDEEQFDRLKQEIDEAIAYDMDTPHVISLLNELTKSSAHSVRSKQAIDHIDAYLGLDIAGIASRIIPDNIPTDVQEILERRERARKAGSWDEADALRAEIHTRGYELRDTEDGPQLLNSRF